MKSITEQLADVIANESTATSSKNNGVKEFQQVLTEIKKTGLIKQPNYNLPMVDTIGKTYYSSINRRK